MYYSSKYKKFLDRTVTDGISRKEEIYLKYIRVTIHKIAELDKHS